MKHVFFSRILLELSCVLNKLEWLSLEWAFSVVGHCLDGSSQFSRGKNVINGCKLSWIFQENMQNSGFHANNGAHRILSLFCTLYRQIHKANYNLISISLRTFEMARVWPSIANKWMNELCTMFTNVILRNQSINQICLFHAVHSAR